MDSRPSVHRTQEGCGLEPASAISGTSRQKFPTLITSPHIHAHPMRASLLDGTLSTLEVPANSLLIADRTLAAAADRTQEVGGSNPPSSYG
jgi:hypothetical protein